MNKIIAVATLLISQIQAQNLLDLNLEDLTQIMVTNTNASLTETTSQDTPATVTIITQKDILESGAKNLDELLEIYVPSFAYMYKVYGSQMGMRGSTSDRNNKILLLVNNRVMNIKTSDGGALTERWFSMLGDIKKITIITGPGSPIYGTGAISGVINIETFNGSNKRGIEISAKAGFYDKFAMAQISYSRRVFDNVDLYFYYGIDQADGTNNAKSPMQFAFDYNGPYPWNSNIRTQADEPYPFLTTNDGASFHNDIRHKLHLQITSRNFQAWIRFTQSSQETPAEQNIFQYITKRNAPTYRHTGTQNQQLTLFTQYRQRLHTNFKINYDLSYQRSSLYTYYAPPNSTSLGIKAWREDNIIAKIDASYNYNTSNLFAFGSEYNYNWFGKPSDIGFKEYSYINKNLSKQQWNTTLFSLFGEYQRHFTDRLTMFAGFRTDKHTHLRWINSPRLSFIYNIENRDVFKLNWVRSNRYSDEAELYQSNNAQSKKDNVEEIDTYEAIYTKYMRNFQLDFSSFYNEHEVIAYNSTQDKTTTLGKVDSYGAEIQLSYKKEKLFVNLSHSYTKLSKFELANSQTKVQNISAMPYGYGDDFANWNNNITKVRLNYQFRKNIKWINSLRIFWGMPGAIDMANYNKSINSTKERLLYQLPYYKDGHTRAFKESMYYNSSLIWNINKKTTLSLYGYNLLGIFNKTYNKRNFYFYTSQYREMAPSIAFGIKYQLK